MIPPGSQSGESGAFVSSSPTTPRSPGNADNTTTSISGTRRTEAPRMRFKTQDEFARSLDLSDLRITYESFTNKALEATLHSAPQG